MGQRTGWILKNPSQVTFRALWTHRTRMSFTLNIHNTFQGNILTARGPEV